MKRFALPMFLMMMMSMSLFAQSTYTQSKPSPCKLSDYVCQQIPLIGGGNYGIVDDSSHLLAGDEFYFSTDGKTYGVGSISNVSQQPEFGTDGPFEFTFSLSDGRTGTVSGQLQFVQLPRSRWTLAIVESSTVTVN